MNEAATTDAPAAATDFTGRLRAAVENDLVLLDRMYRNMHECWVGTGRLMDEGSASHDFHVWREEIGKRMEHLRWMLRDIDALAALKTPVSS